MSYPLKEPMLHISPPFLIDVHTHLQFAAYLHDYEVVIKSTLEKNIWMVNVGTQRETSRGAIALAEKYAEGVYATVGLHPLHTGQSHLDTQELKDIEHTRAFTAVGEVFDYETYRHLALHPKVVAIGECGLDYYRITNPESRIKQKEVFEKHIELSHDVGKPLMIHCRNAFPDLIEILNAKHTIFTNNSPRARRGATVNSAGIIHFFSGTVEDAKKLLELGFSFSFGGVITFTRDYDAQIKYIPLNRIALETDAPYVAPSPYRGLRNEPPYIIETAKKLAELKNISLEAVAAQTTANAKNIFKI